MSNDNGTTQRSVPALNFTQIPNMFYDEIMPEIETMSELKVTEAIMRQTFGWHKDDDQISLKQLEELTGMNRQQVVAGCKSAVKRGYVWCEKRSGRNYFGIHVGGMNIIPQRDMTIIPTKESKKERNSSSNEDEDGQPSPGQFVGFLREELDGADVPLGRNREDRYAREFNELIKKDVSEALLYKVCDRIVERWKDDQHHKLRAEHALEDVVNGKPPKHAAASSISAEKGTPPEVIEYAFANARGDVIRNSESRLRPAMARFDFTTGAQPPWPIMKELGGTDNERWAVLDGLLALCRQAQRESGGAA